MHTIKCSQITDRVITSNSSQVNMSHKNETNNNNNDNYSDNYSEKGQKSKFSSKFSSEKKSFGAFWWLLNQRRKSLPISNTNSSSTPPHKASVPSISMTPINEESNTVTDSSEQKLSTLTRIANNRSSRPNSSIEILKQSTIVSIS